MATWKPLPSVPVQTEGGLTPLTGKYVYGQAQAPAFNSPPHAFKPAPAGATLISTAVVTSYSS
jgi:hypothetical protein